MRVSKCGWGKKYLFLILRNKFLVSRHYNITIIGPLHPTQRKSMFSLPVWTFPVHLLSDKGINNIAPSNMSAMFTPVESTRCLRSCSEVSFVPPFNRLHFTDNNFVSRCYKYWTKVPSDIRSAPSLNSFKQNIKRSDWFTHDFSIWNWAISFYFSIVYYICISVALWLMCLYCYTCTGPH